MRKLLGRGALAAGVVLLALIAWLGTLQATGNFHAVIPGEFYRSAQISGEDLRALAQRHGIRSVVNLRGANPGTPWYDAEVTVARDLGLAHYDFRMSASTHVEAAQAARLLALLRDAPKPVLVHCQSGADRTGLASSLYLAGIAGRDEEEAEWQLSLLYGHIGIPGLSHAWPMDLSWEALEPRLGFAAS